MLTRYDTVIISNIKRNKRHCSIIYFRLSYKKSNLYSLRIFQSDHACFCMLCDVLFETAQKRTFRKKYFLRLTHREREQKRKRNKIIIILKKIYKKHNKKRMRKIIRMS